MDGCNSSMNRHAGEEIQETKTQHYFSRAHLEGALCTTIYCISTPYELSSS